MKRKLISYICLISIFMETVPVNALSNINLKTILQQNIEEESKESSEPTDKGENSNNDDVAENSESKEDTSQAEESLPKLEDNVFNMYILDEKELGFSIGFDEKESKFTLSNQSEKQLSKENLDTIIYKINIYDKENKEKLNIELLGSDTGNSEKLNILKETKYEIGDSIKITAFDPKNGLNILGEIQGDINKEKEDYSDGVDNLDYIDNVRFEITETNLKTVYNEAPVFEGLTDILNVENPNIDVLQGVKVTDDHDGEIDNSKIVVEVQEKTEISAILNYTVQDSWGRSTTAIRNVSGEKKLDSANVLENNNSAKTTQTQNSIADNTITVEGVPYAGNLTERFKIEFDTASKSIKIIDEDGRIFSNTENGEYFKFVLYDKYMEEKASVTLLGSDKSDSKKLEAINNHLYEIGDYIGIWHAESDTKLKINGTVRATQINADKQPSVVEGQNIDYSQGVRQADISERRFRIQGYGLEEVNNAAPVIQELESIIVERGTEKDLLEGISDKITDDFDEFSVGNIESGYVSITHSKFDNTKVGNQTITYTATDRWGNSSTKDRTVTVTSTNPLDSTYIEFMNPSNTSQSLFKIKIDSVTNQLLVDNLDNLSDNVIDSGKLASIFKLKVYTQGGILQKTLNIKGTDKLKTVLRRINGYKYNENDRIELWSTTPENIKVVGQLIEDDKTNQEGYKNYVPNENPTNGVNNVDYKENYENGINDADYMKNVRFEIGKTNLKYIYNQAPEFTISTELTADRKGEVQYMEGISVSDDYDDNEELLKKVTYSNLDTSTIGEKYVEYKVVDSWGRSTLIRRKVTVYPGNNLEYNYITIKNNETNEVILSIRFDEDNKKFKVVKLDASKIPSSLSDNDKLLDIKLIKKNSNPILKLFKSSESEKIITITKKDLIDNNLESKFSTIEYNHGDYLSFNSYDYANGIFISAKSHILLNGFDNEDQMVNSRFEIKQTGLKIIYNSAPEIHGLSDILYVYKGNELTLDKALDGISASDDLDDDIRDITVKYNGNALQRTANTINTNEIGNIKLTYEVTDSWGRTTSGERTLSIISKSVSNDIEFYDESGNNKLFSLKYNPISHEFDVTRNESIQPGEGGNQGTEEQPPTGEDSQSPEEVPPVENGEQALDEAPPTDENNSDSNVDNNEQIPDTSEAVLNLESIEGQEEGQEQSGQGQEQPDQEQQEGQGQEQGQNQESTPQKDVVFRLNVFNVNGQDVGKLELSEEDISSGEGFNQLSNIGVYDDYYFSVWSKTSSRIKIQGEMDGNNTLGEDERQSENYTDGINDDDYMNNVRFKLRTDGLKAVYNKAPEINIPSDRFTEFAGNPIDYLNGVTVSDDHDVTISNEKVKVDVVEKGTENTLVIGENTVNLTVKDSWGREGKASRNITIENGILKNTIRFMRDEANPNSKVLDIRFNHNTKKLDLITYNNNQTFGPGTEKNYVKIKVVRPGKNGAADTTIVPEIVYSSNDKPELGNSKLNALKSYKFEYGDYFDIYHGHPKKFFIDGKVTDSREDYTDGVQNPENILNTKFEITASGLKAIYKNPDENNLTGNNNIIGPMAPEKFPFKLKVVPEERKFKVVDQNSNQMYSAKDGQVVYKLVHRRSDGTIVKQDNFVGYHKGDDSIVSRWNNHPFNYGDVLYIWHIEPHRSIIKGDIIEAREDYSNGVDDPDNMNNVVFRLTEGGLESVYNEAPEIKGVENIDVYQGTPFNVNTDVTYRDDYDTNHLTTSVTGNDVDGNGVLNTSELGEKIVTYTARDRWGKTTEVERIVTVRPNLYKNVFKVFADTIQAEAPISKSDNTEDKRTPLFEIGFDSVNNKYRVFNQKNDRISSNNSSQTAFEISIIGRDRGLKQKITLTGNDRGNSPKLDELNEVTYEEGDIIRVYRSNLDAISIEGDVTGDIPESDQILNETDKLDYMLNTGFKVSNDGLEAVYNYAPQLNGSFEDRTVSKGESINLIDGLDVEDELDDDISTDNIAIYINGTLLENNNYTFNTLGDYNIEYIIYDSWGRFILQERIITVESKVRENEIEVYNSNDNLEFKVKFDTTNSQFVLTKDNNSTTFADSSTEDTANEVDDDSNDEGYFKIIVRDIKGDLKYSVVLNGNQAHDLEELKQIHNKKFSRYDTISLYCSNSNGVRIQGGVIDINNNVTNDYSNGFGETTRYPLVRFKITDDGLKEMTQKDMLISGLEDKSVKRGEDIDFLSGIFVNVQDNNNEDYKIVVNEDDKARVNKLKEGKYNVRYTISNSWGTEIHENITITVEPRTKLEEVKLHVKNTQEQDILLIGFDSIQRKLRVLDYTENATIDSSNTNLAFAINAYDSFGNNLETIEIDGDQSIDQSLITRLNNFDYIEGYRISIWAKNPERHLELDGTINVSDKNTTKSINKNTTTPVDKMENGRFEILSDGLEYIYNKAPVISGGDKAIDYYKGTLLTMPKDISVTDDHDDNISRNQVIIDDDQVDYDILGEQDITYIVEDSWGRVGEKKGKINVISSIDKNEINIFTTADNQHTGEKIKAFAISFERKGNKTVIKISNKDHETFNKSSSEETFMTIKVHDANGKVVKECKLLSSENAVDKRELEALNGFEFDLGGYISIDGIKDETKECVKIIGTVVNPKESYEDGITNLDNIDNVRFKITDFGLESVYNNAPTITINQNISLNAIKGDDIPYMRGVRLTDDHDTLTKANVEVTWNPQNTQEQPSTKTTQSVDNEDDSPIKGEPKVGENILHYKVTDTWGRTCEESREVTLSNGMLSNSILLKGKSERDMAKFTFTKEENDAENQVTLKLEVLNRTDKLYEGSNTDFYVIKITKPGESHIEVRWNSEEHYTNQFDQFNNMDLPYGSTIEFIYVGSPQYVSIDGPVRNQREDYSDGVQNPENLRSIKFMVTDSGLKSVYVERDQITENQNIITVVANQGITIQFKIDPATKTISKYFASSTTFAWELESNIEVFRMTLEGQNGIAKYNVTGTSRQKGNEVTFSNQNYVEGDTLTIWHYTPSRISIKGKEIKGAREDYSDGVDNSENLTKAIFKLTADGLEAVYKDAPKITGIKDAKVLKGQELNLRELTSEIQAKDAVDGNITPDVTLNYSSLVDDESNNNAIFSLGTKSISDSEGTPPPNGETITSPPLDIDTIVVPDKVGMYEVQYSVTNSSERTTTKSSTIIVYDKPTIEADETKNRIELNSIENTEEAIKERLMDAVVVTDEDDDLYGKDTKLEIVSQDVNPNVEDIYDVIYKATDLYGGETEVTIPIQVSRTINVSVPTTIPFQVVTNLTDENADAFISGVMKVQNNNTSDVDVYIDSFTRQDSTTTKNGSYETLKIVDPDKFTNWDNLSAEDSMTKMALGIYNNQGLTVDNKLKLTKQEPLWLKEGMQKIKLGVLKRATTLEQPYESKLSFTSKHGKNFIGGSSKGKFNLVFRFE